jgi:hypothetical protein
MPAQSGKRTHTAKEMLADVADGNAADCGESSLLDTCAERVEGLGVCWWSRGGE